MGFVIVGKGSGIKILFGVIGIVICVIVFMFVERFIDWCEVFDWMD